MKRIIKEELKDGTIQYRVESNRIFFGLVPCKWYSCTVIIPMNMEKYIVMQYLVP